MSTRMRFAPIYPGPLPVPAADREAALAAVLDGCRLRTPPAVAMSIVRATARPDCTPADVSGLLKQDPVLCGSVLKAVNSSAYPFRRTIGSIDQAVTVLGLNPLRALVLGLSIPALHGGGALDPAHREFQIGSVSGAIMARELAVARRHPSPDDDMVAGLLRDLGAIALQQAFPDAWLGLTAVGDWTAAGDDQCRAERAVLGLTHPEVSAALLARWNLPDHLVEAVRHHHDPEQLAAGPAAVRDRAELLRFVDALCRLDDVADNPVALRRLLALADKRFGMGKDQLIGFLHGVAGKVSAFAALLNLSAADCPDLGAVMAAGCEELAKLVIGSGTLPPPAARTPAAGTVVNPPTSTVLADPPAAGTLADNRPGPPPTVVMRQSLVPFEAGHLVQLPKAGARLGDYEVRRRLGNGSMGVVFLGYDPGLAREVAVKLLAPDLAGWSVARERFLREARTAAAVRHPNVMTIFAVRDHEVSPYLVTEYLDGGTLEELIDGPDPLPVSAVVRIACDLAAGLAAAHAERIVHRDVKPSNVLFDGATGRAKITDFGLARGPDSLKLTADGAMAGSPLFMSPEQACRQPLDPRSDLFALGSVLYNAATRRPPFLAANLPGVLKAICEDEPRRPRAERPDLPDWLDEMILKLLRKKPDDRYQSADEVLATLQASRTP